MPSHLTRGDPAPGLVPTMPRKNWRKIDRRVLRVLRRGRASAGISKPKSKSDVSKTAHGGASASGTRKKPKITERDLRGLKYFPLINPLLEKLHKCATDRDRAGNRILHYDQYCSLLLLFFFSPIVDSLRGIQQASQLDQIQRELGCSRASLGSLSEAAHVFDSKLLREIIPELAQKLLPTARGKDAEALRGLTAVDGSLLPALPKMVWALWTDDDHRAAKMHLHFDVFTGIPVDATVTHGSVKLIPQGEQHQCGVEFEMQ